MNTVGTADQKMLDRIAKLLRQAGDAELGDRPAEANAFQDKAFALMATHGVSEALARARLDGLDITEDAKAASVYVHFVGNYRRMQVELFWEICEALHCQAIMLGKNNTLRVYGMPDHLARLQTMWTLLAPQAQRGMANAHPGPGASSAFVANFRRNWLEGFAGRIKTRILKAEDAAAAAEGALVLYKSDQQRADDAMHIDYPKPGSITSSRGFNVDGYDQGDAAGGAAQIHRSVTT